MGVAHPRCEIGSLSGSPSLGTLIKVRGRPGVVGGGRGKSKMSRICKLDIACKHLARRRMTSSPSTRVRKVGQGVTKKGVEFRIRQQTDFRVICTVVLLIQLHENPHN